MFQMPPHIHNIEVSVQQLKHSTTNNSFYSATGNTNLFQANNQLDTAHPQQQISNQPPINDYNYISSELENYCITSDLNRSVGEDTNSSKSSSMDELMYTGHPFDDLLSTLDNNCQIKHEVYDPHIPMYIPDSNADYQQYYTLQQMTHNPMSFTDNQIYGSSPQQNITDLNSDKAQINSHLQHHTQVFKSHSQEQATTSTNLLDLRQIKKEDLHQQEDQSESSYCSSNENYDQKQQTHLNGMYQPNDQSMRPTTMSVSAYKKMSQQSRVAHEKRYGPIVVRPRKNPAPTLASGRKSKYTVLEAEEERKREIRRSRNRQAAEKCKQKRGEIEEQLELRMKYLENEKSLVMGDQAHLVEKKLQLELLLQQHIDHCTNNPSSSRPASINNNLYINSSNSNNSGLYTSQQQSIDNNNIDFNNNGNMLSNMNTQPTYATNYMVPYTNNPATCNEQMSSSYIPQMQCGGHIVQQQQKGNQHLNAKTLNHLQQGSYNY